jgi:sortase A
VSRRRFLLLSGLLLAGVACAPSEPSHGLRGTGTVYRPTEAPAARPEPTAEPTASPSAVRVIEPTPEPIVRPEAVPTATLGGATEAQQHVLPVPLGRPPAPQPLPAKRVVIPTIGLDSKVISLGTRIDRRNQLAWETAPFAVGHHRGTAGPGQAGNMVLSGHISSPGEGAIFHRLPELKIGEGVIVATEERQFLYRVMDIKTVTPDEVSVMEPTPEASATLITCVPDGIYSHRLVVTAQLV